LVRLDNKTRWLRLHSPPKKVARTAEQFRSTKQKWLFARSKDRYDKWPEGIEANKLLQGSLLMGEVGRTENIRLVDLRNVHGYHFHK
jgi:hypothetical protein